MDDKHPHDDEPSVTSPGRTGVSVSRRRFTRAGLSGTVVLGSLASKPVLGAEYVCTLSGHTSANASAHLIDNVNCAAGYTWEYWASVDKSVWPIAKGSLPNHPNCNFNSSGINANPPGQVFNGFGGLLPTFYYETANNSGCDVLITGTAAASMFQVLMSPDLSDLFELGRETIASLLNALKFPSYPVSQSRIVEMFNKVQPLGGMYLVEGANLPLTRLGVIEYFQKINALTA
jgi:hypothetical protein